MPDSALPDIVLPTIHLNGDRKATLATGLRDAYKAIRQAQVALHACAPNARNYPLPGSFRAARRQANARQAALQSVLDSLVAEVEGIDHAYPDAQERRRAARAPENTLTSA